MKYVSRDGEVTAKEMFAFGTLRQARQVPKDVQDGIAIDQGRSREQKHSRKHPTLFVALAVNVSHDGGKVARFPAAFSLGSLHVGMRAGRNLGLRARIDTASRWPHGHVALNRRVSSHVGFRLQLSSRKTILDFPFGRPLGSNCIRCCCPWSSSSEQLGFRSCFIADGNFLPLESKRLIEMVIWKTVCRGGGNLREKRWVQFYFT